MILKREKEYLFVDAMAVKKIVKPRKTVKKPEKEVGEKRFISTGIKELDESLEGGYPSPSVILVEGPPLSGKTHFCITFADAGIRKGKNAIYICTNNFPENIKEIAKSIGRNLEKAIFVDGYSWLVGKKEGENLVSAADLTGFLEVLENVLRKEEADLVIFDSLSSLFLYNDEKNVERFLHMFTAVIKEDVDCALIVIEKGTYTESMKAVLEYITDSVILLENNLIKLQAIKAAQPKKKEFKFEVTKKGLKIIS